MLDALLCLFALAVGCITVPALFWKSYGLDQRWAAFMSRRGWSAGSAYQACRPDMDAVKPVSEPVVWDGSELAADQLIDTYQLLERVERLSFLAALRNDQGEWLLSANALVKAFGGDRSVVLTAIRAVRGVDPAPPPARTIGVNGRQAVEADW